MRAFAPAPDSTVTSSPRPLSFLTVSGVAATRASPARRSLRIASFMGAWREGSTVCAEYCEEDEYDGGPDHQPLHQCEKPVPGSHMFGNVHRTVVGSVLGVPGHAYPQRLDSKAAGL